MNNENQSQIDIYTWEIDEQNLKYSKCDTKIIPIGLVKIIKISCGYDFILALDSNMNLYSFGNNQYGQLGYKNCSQNMSELKQVKFNKKFNISQLRCGFTHAIAFNDREAYGWGQHQCGALGYDPVQVINPWMPRKLPLLVSNAEVLLDVSCGNNTSFVNVSGDFYAMGDNKCRQLGLILKKSYFDFEKVLISKQIEGKKSSKLVCVKAGDGFTVGIDQNGYLYGAGQFSKFGLFLRYNNSLPNGFFMIEQPTSSGYQYIKNVKNVICGTNLLIQQNNNQIIVYGYDSKPIKIESKCNLQVLAHCRQYLALKSESHKSVYKWQKFNEAYISYQKAIKNSKQVKQIEIDGQNCMFGCQGNGKLFKIHEKSSNKENEELSKRERIKRKIEITMEEEKQIQDGKLKGFQYKLRQNRPQKDSHLSQMGSISESDLNKLTQLNKQVEQQKEIIRLYQLYVGRLQMENKHLKQKLQTQELQQIKQGVPDNIGAGLSLLKEMLQSMLSQHEHGSKL